MSDDLLTEAARALRRETAADEDSGKFTRARIMASLHQSQVRRRTRLAFVLPLAASFAAATAWGTVSGRAPEIARTVVQALGFSLDEPPKAPAPPPRPRQRARSTLPSAQPAPAPAPTPSATAPEAVEPEPPPVTVEPQRAAVPRNTPAPRPSASAARVERDPAHELYRAAHRLHFAEQDCERAVPAWSAYLRAAPGGRFAPEARYNQALCLARLGKRDAARAALTPFAQGRYGTYRQREAEALIEALK